MKKIGIDARLYFQTGVGVYLRNLIFYLQKIPFTDLQFYIYVLKSDSEKIHFENKNFIKREVDSRWHTLSEQISFRGELIRDNLDLMHFTYFSYPVLYDKKFVATVHDLTPLLFKTGKASTQNPIAYELKYIAFKFILDNQVKKSLRIITPTEAVKKQIVKVYGEQIAGKINSLYEGVDRELTVEDGFKPSPTLKDKFKEPFFIYVGNFYPHKNVEALIRAFSQVGNGLKPFPTYKLILIGPQDHFSSKIAALIHNLNLDNKITLYTKSSREDLIFFYKNAQALIHPSLSEGFGLPILEAAHFNLPIIASNIAVFKEILGDQYVSFDPENIDDITEKINQFIKEKPKYDYAKIISQFSFEKMAKETFKIYQNEL